MKILMRAAGLGLVLAACATAPGAMAQPVEPAAAETLFRATTLDLSAQGEAKVEPDMASITLGVVNQAPTAAGALSANAVQMSAVIASLKKAGIAERDIQTSNLNLNPRYTYSDKQPPHLDGYEASNQVTVTVHDLKRLGAAVDATVAAGANQVNGISFGLDDRTAAENAAREAAVKALTAKADLYAKATGYRVLRLVSLSEGQPSYPRPIMPMAKFAAARAEVAPTPVAAGELDVQVDISGVYELTR